MAVKREKPPETDRVGQPSPWRKRPAGKFRVGDVEIVSFAEVFVWGRRKDGKLRRVKRICGKSTGKSYRMCKKTAGLGTPHFGVGYCKSHKGTHFQEKMFTLEYLRLRSVVQLSDIMEGVEVSDEEMESTKAEVALLSTMLSILVAKYPGQTITDPTEGNLAVKIISEIARLKKVAAELRTMRLALSPKQIELFVQEVLSIVKEVAGDEAVLEVGRRLQQVTLTFGRGAAISAIGYESED